MNMFIKIRENNKKVGEIIRIGGIIYVHYRRI
ncbi:hypothetical protein SDC9_71223 [bioreactor metagenome]|jgi:hypothetical protein|uniref:Uncharacterized protein n=1 Tax=bioreactor metagenome TaxID=1076179 RepID=A0A644Y9Z3_9ZZZZ